MIVGEIIERLISIKDNCDIGFENREAINNACNILSHNFNRLSTAEEILSNSTEE